MDKKQALLVDQLDFAIKEKITEFSRVEKGQINKFLDKIEITNVSVIFYLDADETFEMDTLVSLILLIRKEVKTLFPEYAVRWRRAYGDKITFNDKNRELTYFYRYSVGKSKSLDIRPIKTLTTIYVR